MQAWQLVAKNQPLVRRDVPVPTVLPDEVLIDIKAAGICHSDLGYMEDEDFVVPYLPFTLGHEIAGVISEIGTEVQDWNVGDRVGVVPVGVSPGIDRDGGYAEQVTARAAALARIPDAVSFEQAAVGLDAGMTSYAAVMGAGAAAPGMKMGIIGLGGLGHLGARLAVLAGCDVYVAELKEQVWPRAMGLGARSVATSITEFSDIELDVIVDFAGFGSTTSDAINTVRRGGRVVQVGLGVTEATVNTYALCVRRVTLVGVLGGELEDAENVYSLMASGALVPEITVVSFLEIPDALRQLSRGATVGRSVALLGLKEN